jgi:hypothetical protein
MPSLSMVFPVSGGQGRLSYARQSTGALSALAPTVSVQSGLEADIPSCTFDIASPNETAVLGADRLSLHQSMSP